MAQRFFAALTLLTATLYSPSLVASPLIQWNPSHLERLLFPGEQLHLTISFQSSQTLSNVRASVVPAFRGFVAVSPSFWPSITKGATYSVDLVVTIPSSQVTGVTYEGVVQLKIGNGTIAKPLPILLDIERFAFHDDAADRVIVDSNGAIYPVDQLIVSLQTGQNTSAALDIASQIGATVVGFTPATNSYEFELATSTQRDLDRAIAELRTDARIRGVLKNYVGELQSFSTDIAHLAMCNSSTVNDRAYRIVKAPDAWTFLHDISPARFSPVTVGVVDTGILRDHPEFVDLLGMPDVSIYPGTPQIWSQNDIDGHGTAVAGVIGANNLSAMVSLNCIGDNALQMNGILGGVAQIGYTLFPVGEKGILLFTPLAKKVFFGQYFYDVLGLTDYLGSLGLPVVNLSFALRRSFLGICDACVADFDHLTQQFQQTFSSHPNSLFIISSGNFGGSSGDYVPGNLGGLRNVLSVGATDLQDQRLNLPVRNVESSSGQEVGIAAPGIVWAPIVTSPGWGTGYGTSFSAPLVSGSAAILQSLGVSSPVAIKSFLTASGDPIVTDKPIGGRRLNGFCAVQLVLPPNLTLTDDFSEGYRDCSRWFTTVQPPGIGLMAVANQQLEMVKASSGNGYMGLASRCKLAGDFDVQVDYKLPIWPAQNFHTVRLIASDLPDGGTGLPGVYRNSYAAENYEFRNQLGAVGLVSVPTSDTFGTIGLKRTGTNTSQPVLSGYDSHGSIGSAPTTSNRTGFTIDFATPSTTAPGDVAIAFDNFKVNAGTVSVRNSEVPERFGL